MNGAKRVIECATITTPLDICIGGWLQQVCACFISLSDNFFRLCIFCAYVRVCTSQWSAPISDSLKASLGVSSPPSLFTPPLVSYNYPGLLTHLHTQTHIEAVSEKMANYGIVVLAHTSSRGCSPVPPPLLRRTNLRRQRCLPSRSFSPSLQDMNETTATIADSNHPQVTKGNQGTRQVRVVSNPGHEQERSSSFGYKSRFYGVADSRPRMASQEMTEVWVDKRPPFALRHCKNNETFNVAFKIIL